MHTFNTMNDEMFKHFLRSIHIDPSNYTAQYRNAMVKEAEYRGITKIVVRRRSGSRPSNPRKLYAVGDFTTGVTCK